MKRTLIAALFLAVITQVVVAQSLADLAKKQREKNSKTVAKKVLLNEQVGEPSDSKPIPDTPEEASANVTAPNPNLSDSSPVSPEKTATPAIARQSTAGKILDSASGEVVGTSSTGKSTDNNKGKSGAR